MRLTLPVRSTTSAYLAHLPHRGIISVTGAHCTEYLNGLVSTSIKRDNGPFYSALLNASGRILYDIFLYGAKSPNGGFLLEYDPRIGEAPPILPYLKRHVLRSRVAIKDVSEQYNVWALWGHQDDHMWETKRKWSFAPSGAIEPLWDSLRYIWGNHDRVIFDRRGVGMGRRILIEGNAPLEYSDRILTSSDDYLLHRIKHGVPEGAELTGVNAFPLESNLDVMGGVDVRKGCYVGQELTSRTYHTGVVRKRILPVNLIPRNPTAGNTPAQLEKPNRNKGLEIRPLMTQGSRVRSSGKLLCSTSGLGLALLRIEHVASAIKGELELELLDTSGNPSPWLVSPFWPKWWPNQPVEQSTAKTEPIVSL